MQLARTVVVGLVGVRLGVFFFLFVFLLRVVVGSLLLLRRLLLLQHLLEALRQADYGLCHAHAAAAGVLRWHFERLRVSEIRRVVSCERFDFVAQPINSAETVFNEHLHV
jgi:hypothetical protein